MFASSSSLNQDGINLYLMQAAMSKYHLKVVGLARPAAVK